jgi:hypothetical protein
VTLKNRVGNFLILFGFIGLLIFIASAIAPPGEFDAFAFLGGAALVAVGVRFRLDKRGRTLAAPPPTAPAAMPAPAPKNRDRRAGKDGPPPGPPPPPPKKRGPLGTIFKGPANRKTAPTGPPPAGAGGKPPAKGRR